jgi:hypothetical protein
MIREAEPLATSALQPMHAVSSLSAESAEGEINRLTWSVLDGSASQADRNRLADLVRAQHASRPRCA